MESTLLKVAKHGFDAQRDRALRTVLSGGRADGRAMTGGGAARSVRWTPRKQAFFAAVLSVTIVQLAVTFGVFHAARRRPDAVSPGAYISAVVGFLVCGLALIFVPMPVHVKLLVYTVWSVCLGVTLSASMQNVSAETIRVGLLGTIAIFGVLLVVGLALVRLGVDLGWMGGLFMLALIALIVARLVHSFMRKESKRSKALAIAGLVLFAAFVVYDVNVIMHKDYAGDFVTGSIDLYLDFVNIFSDLTRVLDR